MPLSVEQMIQNFEFYVKERQIGLAVILAQHFENRDDTTPFKESGYMILSVAAAYFEMIQQFIDGKESGEEVSGKFRSRSWDFFKRGFRAVYPDPIWNDDSIMKIYKVVRCGMYHGGMPKFNCHLSRYFQPGFHLCRCEIHVNPAAVLREITGHFEQYLDSVRRDQACQDNFVAMCKVVGLDSVPPDHTHCDTPGGTVFTPTTPAPWAKGNEPINWKVDTER